MKKFIAFVIGTVIYEIVIVGFGSYWLGGKIGEAFLDMKK